MDQRRAKPRNLLGDISVLYVAVMARAVKSRGANPQPLLDQFGLGESLVTAPDARISIPRFMRLGQAAIELTSEPTLGLTMGELTRPLDAGRAGLAAQAAPDVGSALATLLRYDLLTSQNSRGQPRMDLDEGYAQFYSIRPYNIFNYFVVDSVLAAWTQLARVFAGTDAVLARVEIEYAARGYEEAFEAWFGCPVTFGAQHNRIYVRPEVLSAPCRQAQAAMFKLLKGDCDRDLQRLRAGWGIQDRVREKLASLLEGEAPGLEEVAVELGMAPWTLQRRLAGEGGGYRALVDDTRKDLALDYIRETRLAFSEIAWLLGFSGPPAFHKAYRRWFGFSPGEHRKRFFDEQVRKGI